MTPLRCLWHQDPMCSAVQLDPANFTSVMITPSNQHHSSQLLCIMQLGVTCAGLHSYYTHKHTEISANLATAIPNEINN